MSHHILTLSFGLIQGFKIFSKSNFPLLVILEKKDMKLNVGKMVDYMTRGSCIPTDSMMSGDDYSNLVHNTGIGVYVESDKINLAYLVG